MGPIYNNFLFERGADRQLANIMGKFDCAESGEGRSWKSSKWAEEGRGAASRGQKLLSPRAISDRIWKWGHIACLLQNGGFSVSGLQFQDGIAKHDGKGRGPGLAHGAAVRSQTEPVKTLSLFLSG